MTTQIIPYYVFYNAATGAIGQILRGMGIDANKTSTDIGHPYIRTYRADIRGSTHKVVDGAFVEIEGDE